MATTKFQNLLTHLAIAPNKIKTISNYCKSCLSPESEEDKCTTALSKLEGTVLTGYTCTKLYHLSNQPEHEQEKITDELGRGRQQTMADILHG